ncbi:hypothetical protein [Aureibacter tunicatorum]|uniref:Uncharacterized protein n=1 Tax=Aureibacter tunicatorum TaxID=866807 RepID=A0AAE4BT60_9BACT|nr:hypothetical protein [Aureibacter tunicatorum]MDR6239620.1 hypothetical protein [Aureibacter tunicatorum]BDD04097.1 hypothetical protein AUTU_15800 [Aureibacter tunicatorum]
MPLSFNNLRIGKTYRLINFGQKTEFEVMEINEDENHRLKDINTLEEAFLQDLLFEGRGKDYDLEEI